MSESKNLRDAAIALLKAHPEAHASLDVVDAPTLSAVMSLLSSVPEREACAPFSAASAYLKISEGA